MSKEEGIFLSITGAALQAAIPPRFSAMQTAVSSHETWILLLVIVLVLIM